MSAHVFIVDDDANFRFRTELALKKKGYRVSSASNAKVALDRIISQARALPSFDLILMDIDLATETSVEIFKKIIENNTNTPVLAVSGYFNAEMYHELLQSGCKEILFKPVREHVLADIIERALSVRVS
jgi:DNA-binding NtrC family response regulator